MRQAGELVVGCLTVLLLIGVGIGVGVCIVGGSSDQNTPTAEPTAVPTTQPAEPIAAPTDTPTPIPVPAITAMGLVYAWDNNPVAAAKEYEGKTLDITGKVDSIDDQLGAKFIIVSDGSSFGLTGVQCLLRDNQDDKISALNKGQSIILRGEIVGKRLIYIAARDCTVVSA